MNERKKELKCNIMDDVGSIINTITTKITETQDEFIFQTISDWWSKKTQRFISKQELVDALTLNKKLVRCKDCKFLSSPPGSVMFCEHIHKFVDADWFCADGKRKEDR